MTEKTVLQGGVLAENGRLYVLFVPEEAEDDEAIVSVGRRDGTALLLRELSDLEEFESIIPLSGAWTSKADAACLTSEGDVLYLNADVARAEFIPGAGYSQKGAKGVGRMIALCQVGDRLVATGFGGQVYVRDVDSGWSDISVPPSAMTAAAKPVYFDVVANSRDGSLVFGGSLITEYVETDEINAADEAGDAELLARLMLEAVKPDMAIVAAYDGTWHEPSFEEEELVSAILPLPEGSWLVFVASGTIFETADFRDYQEVFRPQSPEAFDDIKMVDGQPLLLLRDALFRLVDGELVPFEPALPSKRKGCLSVSPAVSGLAAFYSDCIEVLEGGEWTTLTPQLG